MTCEGGVIEAFYRVALGPYISVARNLRKNHSDVSRGSAPVPTYDPRLARERHRQLACWLRSTGCVLRCLSKRKTIASSGCNPGASGLRVDVSPGSGNAQSEPSR